MRKLLSITLIMILVVIGGCAQPENTTEQEPITGLDNGTVKVIREDEGPSKGGILNLFMLNPETLNPLKTKNAYVRQFSSFVFDSLFQENEDGTPVESLVSNFVVREDGLILDLKLHENVLFHDGQELTSDDVAFTIEEIKKAEGRSSYYENVINIDSVKAVNKYDVRIILKTGDNQIIEKLNFPIVPEHVFKDWPIEGHSDELKVIGSGPFMFEAYNENVISLTKNDDWWNLKVPDGLNHPIWIDGINFRVYFNESDMIQAFQRQEIDIAFIEEGDLEGYSKRSDILFSRYESNALDFLLLSPVGRSGSALSREGFRTAIIKYLRWYAYNTPINIGKPAFEQGVDPTISGEGMNRDETLKALEEAGFTYQDDKNTLIFNKDGAKMPVIITLLYNGLNQNREFVSEWVSTALFELGILVNAETATFSEQQAYVESGKFDMMVLGCRMPQYADLEKTLQLLRRSFGWEGHNSVILPLYNNYGAVLYNNRIRGPRNPVWKNLYNGWTEWYLVKSEQ